ncbi:Protein of unknown function, partial [Gryllus bimaculatus]
MPPQEYLHAALATGQEVDGGVGDGAGGELDANEPARIAHKSTRLRTMQRGRAPGQIKFAEFNMTSTKHPTKAEKTRSECKLLAEVAGLKENNRELAKSLAEKRKENIELREMQNKYNKHILNIASSEKFTSDGVTSTSPNVSGISDEASQLDKTETTVVYVNGAQHINDVSAMVNSIGADTYHYSQDENFQNFLADEETIIRRGVDQSLVIPHNTAIPLISMEDNNDQFFSHAQEKVLRTSGPSDVEHQEGEQQPENHIMSLKLLAHSANLANALTRNEVKEKVKSNATEQRGVELHRKYPIILQNPVPTNTKMQTSCKYSVAETEERRTTKLFNTSPGREGKDHYSQCFTNSNLFQSLEQHNCIFNRTVRRSADKNEYTIYCDSSSPNADTEKYLRRYQTL